MGDNRLVTVRGDEANGSLKDRRRIPLQVRQHCGGKRFFSQSFGAMLSF
jgi:hypothetical protein